MVRVSSNRSRGPGEAYGALRSASRRRRSLGTVETWVGGLFNGLDVPIQVAVMIFPDRVLCRNTFSGPQRR